MFYEVLFPIEISLKIWLIAGLHFTGVCTLLEPVVGVEVNRLVQEERGASLVTPAPVRGAKVWAKLYLFKSQNAFLHISNCIRPNCKTYLSQLQMSLSKLQNLFVQIAEEQECRGTDQWKMEHRGSMEEMGEQIERDDGWVWIHFYTCMEFNLNIHFKRLVNTVAHFGMGMGWC